MNDFKNRLKKTTTGKKPARTSPIQKVVPVDEKPAKFTVEMPIDLKIRMMKYCAENHVTQKQFINNAIIEALGNYN